MIQPNVPEDDRVNELLHVEGPAGPDRLRPLLLAQTTSVVRRRRTVRRLGLIAALAGCYLAGLLTTWIAATAGSQRGLIRPDATAVQQEGERPGPAQKVVASAPAGPAPRDAQPPGPVPGPRERSPAVARADFEQIRTVSDRFLREQGDIAAALHYYTRALQQASAEERAISVEKDSWLLMALKQAHIEEEPKNDHDA